MLRFKLIHCSKRGLMKLLWRITTIFGATSEYKVGMMTIIGFQRKLGCYFSIPPGAHFTNTVTFCIFFAICRVVCFKLSNSSLGDRKDIFITHFIIIIKSEVSTFPIVFIFSLVVCLSWLYHHMLSVSNISRRKLGFVSFITVQAYGVRE